MMIYNERDEIYRLSVTLRKLRNTCIHGKDCKKLNCPYIYGASNYLYYSCADALQ